MKLGKRTAKLVREAAVMGYVHGFRHGAYAPEDPFPKDSAIVFVVLDAAKRNKNLYPTLGLVESP